jgi:anti-sigma factor ChrR (cupin superfamily)
MITTLLKAAAGSIYPAHQHGGVEQVYVIDGDMLFDDHALDTGDYEVSESDTRHSSIRTTEGCLALIIHSPHDKVFPG